MKLLWLKFCTLIFLLQNIQAQVARTALDENIQFVLHPFRKISQKLLGSTGVNPQLRDAHQSLGKQQRHYPKSTPFFCNTKDGRSPVRPSSVHKLRPGDIDIIAAMGDSLTAGNAVIGTNVLHIIIENRGTSWSIGGQENWRTYLTLPNILKEFNPKLYGYGVTDSYSTERISKFNTAEPGAMSRDIPHQARILIQRMRSDPKVNMTHDWKMVTLLIGGNDFCADICFNNDPEKVVLRNHEKDIVEALRTLRNNVPRTIVNLVPPPNFKLLTGLSDEPKECYYTHLFECPCLFGSRSKYIDYYNKIMEDWQQLDGKIVQRDEFNTETFTVNFQPFTIGFIFPKTADNRNDFSYTAPDCFHPSQKAQARFANALWNNMLEPDGQKVPNWPEEFKILKCPTKKRPYIATRVNSRQ